jgi:GTP-binding protein
MIIKNTQFLTSVANTATLPEGDTPEIAVAGKSNSGKSSFINFLTNTRLAKTSKEPGRTRLLNFFEVKYKKVDSGQFAVDSRDNLTENRQLSTVNSQFYLVDLPGYGYAKVSESQKAEWGRLIESYLKNGKNLKNVFVLMDIRHDASADDKMLINFLYNYRIPTTIIATKADKLSKMACQKRKKELAQSLSLGEANIILTSSLNKTGKDDVLQRLKQILHE